MRKDQVVQAVQLHRQGWSVRSIARYLDQPYGVVYAALRKQGELDGFTSRTPRHIGALIPEVIEEIKLRASRKAQQ